MRERENLFAKIINNNIITQREVQWQVAEGVSTPSVLATYVGSRFYLLWPGKLRTVSAGSLVHVLVFTCCSRTWKKANLYTRR